MSNFTGAPIAQMAEHSDAVGCEFNSGQTNTQGLKITEEKVLPFVITSANDQTFKSSRIRTVNRRSRGLV